MKYVFEGNNIFARLLVGLLSVLSFTVGVSVQAQSVPDVFVYEGLLLDTSNNPLTTAHDVRISLWKTADFQPTDIDASGSINTAAANYSNWKEVQQFTPDFNGAFSVYFGGVNPLGNIDFSVHKYFQVEIKAQGAPDTDFEILDPTGDLSDAHDRQEIGSVFYAKNAEYVAGHKPGDSAGNVLVLDADGKIAVKHIGNATDEDSFTLDNNNDAVGNIALNFGTTLGKSLFWNAVQSFFEFTDSLKVNGDLLVMGDIITPDKNFVHELVPSYPESTFELDGTNNSGSMYERRQFLSGEKRPVMVWTSNSNTLQDADTYIEFQLPKDVKRFQTPAIKMYLQTEGTVADSKIDVAFMKGNTVVFSENNISQNVFAEESFNLPVNSFVGGEVLTIKIKTYAKNNKSVYLGKISVQTVE